MAEVTQYQDGNSEPNSLHVHTYRAPSDPSKLLCNVTWDVIEGQSWKVRTIADKEEVPSHEFAIERAQKFAHERSIPIILEQNDAA